ncbi:MAG: hypothetical protein EOM46_19195 [Gammaproteobacteria bacterium]|nr:hypothetical protein [Gammaproteobacteria bacterium]
MSVRFRDAYQGGEAYGKTPWLGVAFSLLFWLFVTLTVYVICHYEDPSARRRQVTERSERTVEEAEKNRR